MQHTKTGRTHIKKAHNARRGAGLVRLRLRDLGLGAAGLVVVRALVLGVNDMRRDPATQAGAGGSGAGGGARSRGGSGDTMGLDGKISH